MEGGDELDDKSSGCAMTARMIRIRLSFIVGLGCWIGRVEAQAPADDQVVQARGQTVIGRILPAPRQETGPVRENLHRQGYACGQHLDAYGCGGWHQFNTFVFGSCRTFFGEPCLPNQSRKAGLFGHGGGR